MNTILNPEILPTALELAITASLRSKLSEVVPFKLNTEPPGAASVRFLISPPFVPENIAPPALTKTSS